MKIKIKWILIACSMLIMVTALCYSQQAEKEENFYLITKLGKTSANAERIRYYSNDKLLVLNKKMNSVTLFESGLKNYPLIENLARIVDFDYLNGALYLISGKEPKMKKYLLSSAGSPDDRNAINVDSAFSLDFVFKQPSAIYLDRMERYIIISDTGAVYSVNKDDKLISLKFINLRPADMAFESRERAVYLAERTTGSLVKILTDGTLHQIISNFDCDNRFALNSKADIYILDKLHGSVIKLKNGKSLDIIIENLKNPSSITFNPDNDLVFYLSAGKNEIFRVEEMPLKPIEPVFLLKAGKNAGIFRDDSVLVIIDGKTKNFFALSGERIQKEVDYTSENMTEKTGGKKSPEKVYVDGSGKLIHIDPEGVEKTVADGLRGFKKAVNDDKNNYYALNAEGLLLKIDLTGAKTCILKKAPKNSDILSIGGKILLRSGTDIYALP